MCHEAFSFSMLKSLIYRLSSRKDKTGKRAGGQAEKQANI